MVQRCTEYHRFTLESAFSLFLGGQGRVYSFLLCLAGMLAWMEGYMVIIGFIGYISNGRSALLTNIDPLLFCSVLRTMYVYNSQVFVRHLTTAAANITFAYLIVHIRALTFIKARSATGRLSGPPPHPNNQILADGSTTCRNGIRYEFPAAWDYTKRIEPSGEVRLKRNLNLILFACRLLLEYGCLPLVLDPGNLILSLLFIFSQPCIDLSIDCDYAIWGACRPSDRNSSALAIRSTASILFDCNGNHPPTPRKRSPPL
ncbi:uncharacterized protein MCYG_03228 [Microsporum canis CBS 113480]|uniref:Uncharacterized protein n=1 Tax=Arthroderma otae (strain ATCC MYA-4605 / CBS 113480) TaxID=554155 RepID=C5FL37_ARTOC|nr:uncharacterized protein MCYG_03228 [Microsporum canis CBS 113480]EEQ30409.1 predicted protein [Microsporum canis CBS 113480]